MLYYQLSVHTTHNQLISSSHDFLEVGVSFKGVHITGHHLMAEGILGLWRKAPHANVPHANVATRQCCIVTHSIRHKSGPLHASRPDGLQNVNHTLCLHTLQLGVDTQECSCTSITITIGDSQFETMYTYNVYMFLPLTCT